MPSPGIPHSRSAPDITSPQHIPSSSKSVVTSRSAGSPLTSWPKKLGGFIAGKSKNSDLTEESLRVFNRRNSLYSGSSPYYKGLTDFSLVINREKHSGSSPGRESRATTAASKSSFVVKMQEWGGSCFTSKENEKPSSSSSSSFSSRTKSSYDNRLVSSSSSSSSTRVTETVVLTKIRTKTSKNDSVSVKKRVTIQSTKIEDTFISPTVKKPLRERDSGLSPMLPLSPPPASLPYPLPQITPPESLPYIPPPIVQAQQPHTPDENKEGLTHTGEKERKYIWADRYRPFWLREFLCNREKALWLQKIVRRWQDTQEECGHFIFEGNKGVGKRTMIWAMLREAFGPEKVKVHLNSHLYARYLKKITQHLVHSLHKDI